MVKKFISELKAGEQVISPFLVKERRVMEFRNKPGRYLHLMLGDRTGEIEARSWEEESFWNICQPGEILMIKGEVSSFRESLQMRIIAARAAREGEVELAELVITAPRGAEEMLAELSELIASMRPGLIRLTAEAVLAAPWFETFCQAPAAQSYHHNYVSGLLEHTLGLARLAVRIAPVYPQADRDLLLLGTLIHDVGKVQELQAFPAVEYTDPGRLLGHIVLGVQMIDALLSKIPGMDEETRLVVLHLIASHHGEYEWQSPKRPKLLEAYLLHVLDMLDANAYKYISATSSEPGNNWSSVPKGLRNPVYLGWRRHQEGASELTGKEA